MRFYIKSNMRKNFTVLVIFVLALTAFLSSPSGEVFAFASGQQAIDNKQAQIDQIINSAERHYVKGEDAYKSGQYDFARNEFDQAVDTIFIASIDVRSDDRLRIYYRQLVEKINRYQVESLDQKDGGFSEQRYEPSPLDRLASLSEAELDEVVATDIDVSDTKYNFEFNTAYPVMQFISYFTKGRGRATMEAGLRRSVRYRELATRIFKEEGVPTDIIWLAQVESSWNPYASSWAGAKGIWQFMPATGSRFGLSRNYWVDERSHPEKATRAAAKYLKWLATRYKGNWTLALAAYNTGEGNVDSAIARSGSRDFWRLHSSGYMAQETRNYVPAILAVITIAKNPGKYGFEMPPAFNSKYETLSIAKQSDLRPLAKKLNISYGSLLDLNPELQHGITPPGKHVIRIPAELAPKAEKVEGEGDK
jgi:membrane-bound lytic murein transglycosylase D